jgi:hypothetical protein
VTDSLGDELDEFLGGYIDVLDAAGTGLPFSRSTGSPKQPSRRTMADADEPGRQANEGQEQAHDGAATQGLGKVSECRFHGVLIPRMARVR